MGGEIEEIREGQGEGALGIQGRGCHSSSRQAGDQAQIDKRKAGYKAAFGKV